MLLLGLQTPGTNGHFLAQVDSGWYRSAMLCVFSLLPVPTASLWFSLSLRPGCTCTRAGGCRLLGSSEQSSTRTRKGRRWLGSGSVVPANLAATLAELRQDVWLGTLQERYLKCSIFLSCASAQHSPCWKMLSPFNLFAGWCVKTLQRQPVHFPSEIISCWALGERSQRRWGKPVP